jgi:hypothetical protein
VGFDHSAARQDWRAASLPTLTRTEIVDGTDARAAEEWHSRDVARIARLGDRNMSPPLRPVLVVVLAVLGAASGAAFAATPTTAEVYLQRGSDGRSVLTDRPSADAVTERTWHVNREDPALAQQRALEVQRHADAVSERIQRTIEAQERRASEADLLRMRLAQLERQYEGAASDGFGDGVVVAPIGFRGFGNRGDNRRPPHRSHSMMHSPLR